MDMAKALAAKILPKDLNLRYCVEKIPDWEPAKKFPIYLAALLRPRKTKI